MTRPDPSRRDRVGRSVVRANWALIAAGIAAAGIAAAGIAVGLLVAALIIGRP